MAVPRVGLTVGRAMGKAVARNRIKRRMRAAVQNQIATLSGPVDVVLHPQRRVAEIDFSLITRCPPGLSGDSAGDRPAAAPGSDACCGGAAVKTHADARTPGRGVKRTLSYRRYSGCIRPFSLPCSMPSLPPDAAICQRAPNMHASRTRALDPYAAHGCRLSDCFAVIRGRRAV